jgi:hypothetical protein
MAWKGEHVKRYLAANAPHHIENGHAIAMPRPTHHCHPQTSAVIVEGWHYPQTAGNLKVTCSFVLSPTRFLLPSFFLFPHFFFFQYKNKRPRARKAKSCSNFQITLRLGIV